MSETNRLRGSTFRQRANAIHTAALSVGTMRSCAQIVTDPIVRDYLADLADRLETSLERLQQIWEEREEARADLAEIRRKARGRG